MIYSRPSLLPSFLKFGLLAAFLIILFTLSTYTPTPSFPLRQSSYTTTEDACPLPLHYAGYVDASTDTYHTNPGPICPNMTTPFTSLPIHLENLRNKTLALYGDSVTRFFMSHICETYNGTVTLNSTLTPHGLNVADPHHQSVHTCEVPSLGLKMYNTYIMGLREWQNDTIDREFTRHHPTFHFNEDPTVWRYQNRIQLVEDMVRDTFPDVDAVVLGTGVWDVVDVTQRMLQAFIEQQHPQTPEAHEEWLQPYRQRLRDFIRFAHSLHTPPTPGKTQGRLKKIFFLSLHDLDQVRVGGDWKNWQMHGFSDEWKEKAEFSPIHEDRVRSIRIAQMQVVEEERERFRREGWRGELEMLPYEMWVKAVRYQERLSDVVHPAEKMNKWAALGLAMAARGL
ncbi:hypothetical protein EX30DRAFT_340188 [Ascodesmis nigricans]|uniref:SGNH hydrolase n=1 Tax=Ascodesmis nigricans TaxID=341454 RepID=A0A4S2N099_9PEZI|nr:hypothetical protein EX30DRAFT_340188 [Ascodesmis nigricans]